MLINDFQYRPEIDGLRAIAVFSVILFHAGFSLFGGGYVGVDVFFVISGYLITSLIIRDIEAGSFRAAAFWERRIRRILPAACVVVAATLAGGWLVLLPADFQRLAQSALYQAFCAANFYFRGSSPYFAGPSEEQPLLHTWSLAVEEQFYFLFPFLLVGLLANPAFRKRGPLLATLGAMAGASLVLSIWALPRMPAAAFYLLPFRAWELLLGALVAVMPRLAVPAKHFGPALLGWLGLGLIGVPVVLYSRQTPFPGWAAVPPCLGTALVIWALHPGGAGAERSCLPARLLRLRPLVFAGLISYSLYLWHWPLLVGYRYLFSTAPDWRTASVLVALATALAIASYYLVELPIRHRKILPTVSGAFVLAGCCAGLVAVPAWTIDAGNGIPQRLAPKVLALAGAKQDFEPSRDLAVSDVPEHLVRFGVPSGSPRVIVWGDSHASAIVPCLDRVCRDLGFAGAGAIHCSTAPVLDWYVTGTPFGLNDDAPEFGRRVVQFANDAGNPAAPFVVVLAARWSGYLLDAARQQGFAEALRRTVETLVRGNCRVVILKEVPGFRQDVPRSLALAERCGWSTIRPRLTVNEHRARVAAGDALIERVAKENSKVIVIDPLAALPVHNGVISPQDFAGAPLWMDTNHLSKTGSLCLAPSFRKALLGAVARNEPREN